METQCVFYWVGVDFLGAIYVRIKLKTIKYSKAIEKG
jgi:hypothetical protein